MAVYKKIRCVTFFFMVNELRRENYFLKRSGKARSSFLERFRQYWSWNLCILILKMQEFVVHNDDF